MSEIKALDNLRDSLIGYQAVTGEDMGACLLHADELEAEVADRYIELPRDVNGDVWHIGDAVYRNCSDRDLPNVVTGLYFFDSGEHELMIRTSTHTAWTPKANKVRHDKEHSL